MPLRCLQSIVLVLLLSRGCSVGIAADESLASAERFQVWGEEVLALITRDFWLTDEGLYAEHGRRRSMAEPRQAAFMWSAGVQLTALAAAADMDADNFAAPMHEYAAALERYWCEHDGVGGYDVLPGAENADRYYDDNAWIVLALCEIHEQTGEQCFLEQAERTFRFVMSGEDDALGGGIYWRENKRESKNTCSNAPAIVGALRLYQATGREDYLVTARRLYVWTCDTLQDNKLQDKDGLFFDNVKLDGSIDRRKFSYNSALMIRANCLLFEIEKDPKYLAEAQRIARAAQLHWIPADNRGVRDAGRFAHLLLEGFLAVSRLDGDRHWLECSTDVMTFVHDNVADERGRYPTTWDRPATERRGRYELLDQASTARAYLVLSKAWRESGALHEQNK